MSAEYNNMDKFPPTVPLLISKRDPMTTCTLAGRKLSS